MTGSPYKLHLQETLEEKKKKNDGNKTKDGQKKNKHEGKINVSKKRQHYKDAKKKQTENKRPKKEKPKEQMWDESSEEDDNTACIYCNELYSDSMGGEGWIQCIQCRRWAHENCSGPKRKMTILLAIFVNRPYLTAKN